MKTHSLFLTLCAALVAHGMSTAVERLVVRLVVRL
jgi:hypothetical protein